MANAILTYKVMGESPDVDFEAIAKKAEEILKAKGAKGETKTEIKPLAFGLKEIFAYGMFEVDGADFDAIAEEIKDTIEGVQSAEVANMDLAMG